MRLFAAIDLTAEARDRLAAAIGPLREALGAAGLDEAFRWVPIGNLHLTLRFLGSIDEPVAARVIDAMREPAGRAPVRIVLGRLGTFPGRGRPRVLHVAVEQGSDALRELRDVVDARLAGICSWEADTRPFAPHLTLARARERAKFYPVEFSRLLDEADWPRVAFDADAVTLFSSRTLPAGPEYTPEARAALNS